MNYLVVLSCRPWILSPQKFLKIRADLGKATYIGRGPPTSTEVLVAVWLLRYNLQWPWEGWTHGLRTEDWRYPLMARNLGLKEPKDWQRLVAMRSKNLGFNGVGRGFGEDGFPEATE